MTDKIRALCPQCRNVLRMRREYLGRKVACKYCGVVFTAADSDGETAEVQTNPSAVGEAPEIGEPSSEGRGLTASFPDLSAFTTLEAAIERLEQENRELRTALTRAQAARVEPSEPVTAVASPTESRADLEAKTRRLEEELDSARREMETLRSDAERSRDDAARLADELGAAKQAVESARSELARTRADDEGLLDAARTQAAETRAQLIAESEERLRAWQEEREALQEMAVSRQAEADAMRDDLQRQLDGQRAAQSRLVAERDSLRGDLDSLQQRLQETTGALETEQESHRSTRTELEESSRRLDSIQRELGNARAELETLQGECQRLRTDGSRLDSALRDAQSTHRTALDGLNTRLSALESQHATATADLASVRETLAQTSQEKEAERAASAEARRTAQDRISQLVAELDHSRIEANDARGKLVAEHNLALRSVENQLLEIRTTLQAREEELAQSGSARRELEQTGESLQAKIADLEAQLEQAKTFRHQIRSLLAGLGIRLPG